MLLGRQRWRSNKESPTLSISVLGSSAMDKTVYPFNIHVHWQPRPFFGVQLQSAAAFQCTQKDGEEDAALTDYQWAICCLLTPPRPNRHPMPFSLPPASGLSRTFLYQSQAFGSQTWTTIILLINENGDCYNTMTSTCICNWRNWCIKCLMHICNIKVRGGGL